MGEPSVELLFPLVVLVVGIAAVFFGFVPVRRRSLLLVGSAILVLLAVIVAGTVLREVARPATTTVPYPGTTSP